MGPRTLIRGGGGTVQSPCQPGKPCIHKSHPTASPTVGPTTNPPQGPTVEPTVAPSTPYPTSSHPPTFEPTLKPTGGPTTSPTYAPTDQPTVGPTIDLRQCYIDCSNTQINEEQVCLAGDESSSVYNNCHLIYLEDFASCVLDPSNNYYALCYDENDDTGAHELCCVDWVEKDLNTCCIDGAYNNEAQCNDECGKLFYGTPSPTSSPTVSPTQATVSSSCDDYYDVCVATCDVERNAIDFW